MIPVKIKYCDKILLGIDSECKPALHLEYIDDEWVADYKIRARRDLVEEMKYYAGFALGRERKMFENELNDLNKLYARDIESIEQDMKECLRPLLHVMEIFVKLHKAHAELEEKIDTLKQKLEPREDNE